MCALDDTLRYYSSNKLQDATAIHTDAYADAHHRAGSCKLICCVPYANMKLLLSGCILIPHYSSGSRPIRLTLKWIVGD